MSETRHDGMMSESKDEWAGTLEGDVAKKDAIQRLKIDRGHAKGMVTRRMNEIITLKRDPSNLFDVKKKLDDFRDVVKQFDQTHDRYCAMLVDECDQLEAKSYFRELHTDVDNFMTVMNTWVQQTEEPEEDMSTQLRHDLDLLKRRQELEEQQFRLRLEREELDLRLKFQGLNFGQSSSYEQRHSIVDQNSQIDAQRLMLDTMQLPKVELMKFDGDPLKYHVFMRCFQNVVDSCHVPSHAKLCRLLQYCTGDAYRVIECCAVMEPEAGYNRAKALLKERFGNEFVICNAWVRKVCTGNVISANNGTDLQVYADELRSCQETLSAMNKLHEVDTQRSLVQIVSRLPNYLQNRWRKKAVESVEKNGSYPGIDTLVKFVEMAAKELSDPVFGIDFKRDNKRDTVKVKGHNYSLKVDEPKGSENKPVLCILCSKEHSLFGCENFKAMRTSERTDLVRKKGLCFNCLRPGHMSDRCGLNRTCTVNGCGKKHTKFLHPIERRQSGDSGVHTSDNFSLTAGVHRVALPIVPVIVKSPDSRCSVKTYALLDNGSTHSFCSEDLLEQLRLKGRPEKLSLTTLNSSSEIRTSVVNLQVEDKRGENKIYMTRVYSRPKLSISLNNMARTEDLQKWTHLKDLDLPSVDTGQVQLLIGQDHPEALLPREVRGGEKGEPYATRTLFGWALNGPVRSTCGQESEAFSNFVDADADLNDQLKKFWEIENCGLLVDDKRAMSQNDTRVVSMWYESLEQNEDQHYETVIPLKQRPPALPNNRHVTEHRLECLKRKLTRDPVLHQSYCGFMTDLLEKGYAEHVDIEKETNDLVWYLPHHSVFHQKKPNKVRIVFDCSAKCCGTSLNDQVLQGPDLACDLLGVLLRFRQESVAVMSDIEAMFHQVRVSKQDRDLLRFLWWPNGDLQRKPEVYRMKVHLFGGTWSPSCCNFVLRHTALRNQPLCDVGVVNTVLKNFYVDDCLKSVPDTETAVRYRRQLCDLLATGGFRLTKWVSNDREVLATIPVEERGQEIKGLDLFHEALPVERALGVYWDTETDEFGYKIILKDKPLTRRGLLSVLSSIYDPLGFAGPYILQAKLIVQDLSRMKLEWDDSLPAREIQRWLCWQQDLPEIEKFRVRRCVKTEETKTLKIQECQLHLFSDASQVAYGATAYLRMRTDTDEIHCCLIKSTSRLAPIKTVTVPRLELMAASLAVKLDYALKRELEIPISRSIFWTDSTTVLKYITNDDKRYHTFVANRVALIRDGSEPAQWRYVNTKNNPADDASRGMTVHELLNQSRWLNGPDFLSQDEEEWPDTPVFDTKSLEGDPEVRTPRVFVTQIQEPTPTDQLLQRRSSLYKLKKDIAWWLRLKQLLLNKVRKASQHVREGPLSVEELREAEIAAVKYIQGQHFEHEISCLSQNSGNKLRNRTLARLVPVVSHEGVLRVGGRLKNAPIAEEARHPMILPKCHFADLVIRYCHETSGHTGREHVMSLVRERFWLLGGRTAVRRILHNCWSCRRRLAPGGEQRMADLPVNRVIPGNPPFSYTGVDFFGTFFVKRGRSLVKRYGCIFTCLTTRATHIEVAHSLDTDSFVNALQRFICRRGQPIEICSDNGTNFVASEKELRNAVQSWNQNRVEEFLRQREIRWKFNPPSASHMGGAWERQIRSVRKVLGGLTREQTLDDEGLSTLLCLVESIVNSRPLTTVSDDARDLEPLTPNHLLLLRSGPTLPPGQFEKTDLHSRKRWRQIQYLADIFWRRWCKEYLPTLQQRRKWIGESRNFKVNDVVLVTDQNLPRGTWPLARIVKVHSGKDGRIRSADVRTSTSTLTRPIVKLVLLEAAE